MSSRNLCIAVTFLTGRYHGEEWPPSPARLYQAIVAGVMTCGYAQYAPIVEPALRWLEGQKPPLIRACSTQDAVQYRIAVPNNDMDVIAKEWLAGRAADPSKLKTMKLVNARQMEGNSTHVRYIWSVDHEEALPMLEPIRKAAHCLHTLGWGVDMAYADLTDGEGLNTLYEPATSGELLAVPMPGTLDDVHATYQRFSKRTMGRGVDTHTRISMLRMQPYRPLGSEIRPVARFLLMKPDTDELKSIAWQDCMKVAGWFRHAAAEHLRDEYGDQFIEEYIQGHTQAADKSRRISYVPLPSIFGKYGDGRMRRGIIVEPPDSGGEVVRLLELKLTGCTLSNNHGQLVCCLGPSTANDWTFNQYLPGVPRKTWRTVTPVILHGYNIARHGTISVCKTEHLLLRAFAMAGYGEEMIEGLAFQGAPFWPGTKHASAMQVPNHLEGYPRLHVQVQFKTGVRGPVLAGIGRHYGIGLFAAMDE